MTITAAMVKELRELTGAGVMACKKALVETDGDQEAAIEILRKKGEATAVKKSGRIAAEGVVFTAVKDGKEQSLKLTQKQTSLLRTKNSRHSYQTLQIRFLILMQQIWTHSWLNHGHLIQQRQLKTN